MKGCGVRPHFGGGFGAQTPVTTLQKVAPLGAASGGQRIIWVDIPPLIGNGAGDQPMIKVFNITEVIHDMQRGEAGFGVRGAFALV